MTVTRPTHLGLAVATLALLSFGTVPASAYQRTMTCGTDTTGECKKGEKAKPLWWPVHCLTYRINERGTDQFPRTKDGEIGGQLRDLVKRGFRAWSNPDCSELQIESRGLTPNDRVRYRQCKGWQENENVVVWRDDGWPHTSTATIALTSVHYDPDDGRILDADIEFNTSFYDFTNLDEPGEKNKIDFLNTHTHEVGHFVGLDHPGDHPEATMHAQAR
ncbi:MAG: hypothetical protein ABEL76_01350, partial [Bradymonadaceae bacterium]